MRKMRVKKQKTENVGTLNKRENKGFLNEMIKSVGLKTKSLTEKPYKK
jgi:hypothetical protein